MKLTHGIAMIGLAGTLAGCGTTYAMVSDPSVPFAEGEVTTPLQAFGDTSMAVRVDHLGHPSKLDPQATTYVVWVLAKEDGARPQNVGTLEVDWRLVGVHRFTTKLNDFDVWVTTEKSGDAAAPTGRKVLSTTVTDAGRQAATAPLDPPQTASNR